MVAFTTHSLPASAQLSRYLSHELLLIRQPGPGAAAGLGPLSGAAPLTPGRCYFAVPFLFNSNWTALFQKNIRKVGVHLSVTNGICSTEHSGQVAAGPAAPRPPVTSPLSYAGMHACPTMYQASIFAACYWITINPSPILLHALTYPSPLFVYKPTRILSLSAPKYSCWLVFLPFNIVSIRTVCIHAHRTLQPI
jgi:hypothetical protein